MIERKNLRRRHDKLTSRLLLTGGDKWLCRWLYWCVGRTKWINITCANFHIRSAFHFGRVSWLLRDMLGNSLQSFTAFKNIDAWTVLFMRPDNDGFNCIFNSSCLLLLLLRPTCPEIGGFVATCSYNQFRIMSMRFSRSHYPQVVSNIPISLATSFSRWTIVFTCALNVPDCNHISSLNAEDS